MSRPRRRSRSPPLSFSSGTLVEEQTSAGRGVEQAEQVEQRRLAAAGTADDAHVIADLDLEVDAAQDLERLGVRQLDGARDALEAEQAHLAGSRR